MHNILKYGVLYTVEGIDLITSMYAQWIVAQF